MKQVLFFHLFFWLLCWLPAPSWASNTTPAIVRSAQNGNYFTATTWVGGAVPDQRDYVVIDHAVALNGNITSDANYGSLVVNNGGSLTGNNTITANAGYSVTNNGTLNINAIQLNSTGSTFVNNATATLNGSQTWNTGSQVINNGYLTVNGNISLVSGSRLENRAARGQLILSGTLSMGGSAVWDNVGYFKSTNNDASTAITLSGGSSATTGTTIYNRPTGRIVMTSGGIKSTGSYTYIYNENYLSALNIDLVDGRNDLVDEGTVQNTDTLLVGGQLTNGVQFKNQAGAALIVSGRLNQLSRGYVWTNGYVYVGGNLDSDKRLGGNSGGQFNIAGVSTNTANGTVEGAVDFCDPSVSGSHNASAPTGVCPKPGTGTTTTNPGDYPNIFDSNASCSYANNLGVSTNVTRCAYTALTAALKPDVISGPATVCPNSTGNVYSIAAVSGATSYTWTVPTGWTVTAGAGTTSITATAGTAGGTMSVRVNGSGSNYAVTSKIVTASGSAPATPGSIVGPNTTLCPSTQGYAYTIQPVSGATGYTWTLPTGWVLNYGQGSTSISVTAGATSGNITVTASNACGTSSARSIAVGPPATLTAPASMTNNNATPCYNNAATYTVSAVAGAVGYRWAVTGISGATIDTNNPVSPGVYGTSRQVTYTQAGVATITVTPVNACGDGPSISQTVNVSPSVNTPTFNPGGNGGQTGTTKTNNIAPCANTLGYVYQVDSIAYATRYNWNIPSGWTVTSPVLSNPTPTATSFSTALRRIVVTPGSTGNAGQLNVRAVGCNESGQAQLNNNNNLTPSALPSAPTNLTGPTTYCPGTQNTYTANITNGNGAVWTVPVGWTQSVTTVGVLTTLTATPNASTATDGAITVVATNANGCPSAALSRTVTSTAPTPVFTASSATVNPALAIAGQSYTYQVAAVAGATAYNWTVPSGWTITAGNNTRAITVTTGSSSGNITVSETQSNCTSALASRNTQIDQPALYTASGYAASKKMSCYSTGQSLYQVSDANGGIASASGTLPAGVGFSSTNVGELVVSNATALVAGLYSFTVNTTDALGGQTSTPLNMAFTADQAPTVTVNPKKNLESYQNSDVLATYSDADGTISSLALASGTQPAGTVLDGSTGQLLVQDRTKLTPGDYNFTVSTSNTTCSIGLGQRATALSIGSSVALPVELKAFDARRNGKEVLLTWSTASEKNSDYFAVERSLDGQTFAQLTVVDAQGNSARLVAYAATDVNTLPATTYYRLRMADRDGKLAYSPVRAVAAYRAATAELVASLFPNPTTGRARLQLSSGTEAAQVSILQAVGTCVFAAVVQPDSAGEVSLDLTPYPTGVYLVKIQVAGRQTTLRVARQ